MAHRHDCIAQVSYCFLRPALCQAKCLLKTLKRPGDTPFLFRRYALYTPTRRCYLSKRDKELRLELGDFHRAVPAKLGKAPFHRLLFYQGEKLYLSRLTIV